MSVSVTIAGNILFLCQCAEGMLKEDGKERERESGMRKQDNGEKNKERVSVYLVEGGEEEMREGKRR